MLSVFVVREETYLLGVLHIIPNARVWLGRCGLLDYNAGIRTSRRSMELYLIGILYENHIVEDYPQ